MRPVLISVSLALILGIAIGAMLPERSALPPAPEPAAAGSASEAAQAPAEPIPARQAANTEIEQLKRLLRDEIRAREILAQRLEALNRRVAAIDSGKSGPPASADSQNSADDYLDQAAAGERQWFDQQALLDSGMDDIQVQQLKLFFETLEMERLYLRDRAARESWERGRLREEMQSLQDREETLKQELGEDGYDAYLYASGQTNRVEVSSVLESAQAGQAGIKSGDQIIRYDNERIYNWRDLRNATTAGEITDTVEVEVEREGETLQFYLARGPLGIRMNSLRVAP